MRVWCIEVRLEEVDRRKLNSRSRTTLTSNRAVRRSENPAVPVLFGGHNLPLVEKGLTDLPKSRGAMAPPGTTPLLVFTNCSEGCYSLFLSKKSFQPRVHFRL